MPLHDLTNMGGDNFEFITTCWSDLEAIRSNDEEIKKFIIGNLLKQYWKPVYCYIRRKDYNNDEAKDLTQKFFHEVVLEGELAEKADESKGRFRTFLLRCLDYFLVNDYQHKTAKKRMPLGSLIYIDQFKEVDFMPADNANSPEAVFHQVWVKQIIEDVIKALEKSCMANGQEKHWEAFRYRILLPIMYDEPAPSLGEICEKLSIESESRASNMIITVKRRFRRILSEVLARQSDSDCDLEIEDLIAKLLQK